MTHFLPAIDALRNSHPKNKADRKAKRKALDTLYGAERKERKVRRRKTPVDRAREEFERKGYYTTDLDGKPIAGKLFKPSLKLIHHHNPDSPHAEGQSIV